MWCWHGHQPAINSEHVKGQFLEGPKSYPASSFDTDLWEELPLSPCLSLRPPGAVNQTGIPEPGVTRSLWSSFFVPRTIYRAHHSNAQSSVLSSATAVNLQGAQHLVGKADLPANPSHLGYLSLKSEPDKTASPGTDMSQGAWKMRRGL